MRRVLGLFAHPDDEIFCAGGTMARAAAAGAEVAVVSFTRGEAGRIGDAALARRSTIGAVREAELAEACARLGVSETRCLDFADGTLASVDESLLIDAATDLIREFRPDTIVSFDETGAYGHPDHITMSAVSVAAAEAAADPLAQRSAAAHVPDRVMHACFPQSERLLLDLLVEWLTSMPERFRGTDTFVNALLMFADSSSMLGFAADHLRIEWFPRGSYVVEQGEAADSLYLLLSGVVDVHRERADGTIERLGVVSPGEFIGELGLASGGVRSAHCIAAENTACFVFTASADSDWKPRGGGETPAGSRTSDTTAPQAAELLPDGVITHDVRSLVDTKLTALAAHRSQYTIEPGLFPRPMLDTILGTEYFVEAWSSPAAPPLRLPEGPTP